MTAQLSTPLSDEELDRFLLSAAVSDETMLLDTLDDQRPGSETYFPSQPVFPPLQARAATPVG